MSKKNILLIGCGNIGLRHIELLLKESTIKNIYVYDKHINNSKKLIDKLNNHKKIVQLKNFNTKVKRIFLCILATHSYRRFFLLSKIINLYNPKYILAEKLLENSVSEINKYHNNFTRKKIYVNCSNRMRSIFLELLKKYHKKKINMNVNGGGWNLLSNCIHFIDFIALITNEQIKRISINENSYLIKSKHNNFKELIGEMVIEFKKGSILKLNSKKSKKDRIMEIVDSKNNKTITNLDQNKITFPNKKKFKMQYQSLLTFQFYKKLIKGEKINLPDLKRNVTHTKVLLTGLKRSKLFKYKKDIMVT